MLFKDRLRNLREEKEITQNELGKYLGVGGTTVNGYEKGIIENPPLDKLIKLSDYFSVSIDYLAARTSVRNVPNDEQYDISKKLQHILDILSSENTCYYQGKPLTADTKELLKTLLSGSVVTINKIIK